VAGNPDADAPFSLPPAVWWVLAALAAVFGGAIVYAWRVVGDGLGALTAGVSLMALVAASAAVLYAYPEYREWRAEHHRAADFDLWIEIAPDTGNPGTRLEAVRHESDLPVKPMLILEGDIAIVRACVEVRDRFPLRNCIVNIVVPSDYGIDPVQTGNTRPYPTVTENARVNPTGHHGCRFTVLQGDFSPKGHITSVASIRDLTGSGAPFRLMVELSCTPAPRSESDRYRFALIALG
jgi:hypothetical protein